LTAAPPEPVRSATWPFPKPGQQVERPTDDVLIENQRAIEAMQRGVEKRKANRAREMKEQG
jgi:hypothetical protein